MKTLYIEFMIGMVFLLQIYYNCYFNLMSLPQTRAQLISAIRLKNLPNEFTIPGSQIPLTTKKQLKYLTKPLLESIYASTKRSNYSDKFHHRRPKLYIANLNKIGILEANIKRKLKLQHAQSELHEHLVVLHQILKRAHRGETIHLKKLYAQLPSSGYFSLITHNYVFHSLYLIATGTTPPFHNHNYMQKVVSLINKIQKLKAKIYRIKQMK